MDWIFLGSGRFGAKILEALLQKGFSPKKVFTLPDRPQKRGRKLLPVPVKEIALRLDQDVEEINSKKDLHGFLFNGLIVSVDIGIIFPSEFVKNNFCVNVHPSLLPRWRGPAPIFWTLLSGEEKTGVTVFKMDEGVDTGLIIKQKEISIQSDWNYADLEEKLVTEAAYLLPDIIEKSSIDDIDLSPQEGQATYAKKVSKELLRINWHNTACQVNNLVKAASPYWGAWAFSNGKRFKFYKIRLTDLSAAIPGQLRIEGKRLFVSCNDFFVEILEIQPEGKNKMYTKDFLCGYGSFISSGFY